MKGNLYAHNRP